MTATVLTQIYFIKRHSSVQTEDQENFWILINRHVCE